MPARQILLVAFVYLAIALGLYAACLRGGLISDDWFLLRAPEIQTLSAENLRAILAPGGSVAQTYVNYSPVHALLHALEIRAFGDWLPGYHLVNVFGHALVSALLVALFVDTGIPRAAALAAGTLFLVHPANVEAVAWISQLKTLSAAALAIGALLARRRRAVAALLFALALLAKAQAAFALPVLAALDWSERSERSDPARWRWLSVWLLAFAAYAFLEGRVYAEVGAYSNPALAADRLLHLRQIPAIAARYLVMAATGYGLSTLHEPPLPVSWADPWWCGGALARGAGDAPRAPGGRTRGDRLLRRPQPRARPGLPGRQKLSPRCGAPLSGRHQRARVARGAARGAARSTRRWTSCARRAAAAGPGSASCSPSATSSRSPATRASPTSCASSA